ncbi:glycosyltransferase [Bacillus sp. C1-1]|nr:glycosyltransferase [Bacillus sp. C1-1]
METVTVLMSVYNDKKYLRESLDSILSQTHQNFEFLIIDDASNDGSIKILEEYNEKDKRIKLIRNVENKGLSFNLNYGVLQSKNEWIVRMDADDVAFKDRIEKQLNFIKKNPDIDVLGSFVIDVDRYGQEIELRKVPISHEKIANLIWTCPFIHPTVMLKRESVIKAGSYNKDLKRRQDYDLWFRCHAFGLRFANIDEPLLYYRTTDEYFKKNNFKVQVQQVKMGIRGAKMVKASPVAYVGITVAFIKGILPIRIRKQLNSVVKSFDPRRK